MRSFTVCRRQLLADSTGPPGAGKTALAATIAKESGAPFVKLVASESMVGFGEAQKVAYINKIFTDAYKSALSVVVVDSIERLIGQRLPKANI